MLHRVPCLQLSVTLRPDSAVDGSTNPRPSAIMVPVTAERCRRVIAISSQVDTRFADPSFWDCDAAALAYAGTPRTAPRLVRCEVLRSLPATHPRAGSQMAGASLADDDYRTPSTPLAPVGSLTVRSTRAFNRSATGIPCTCRTHSTTKLPNCGHSARDQVIYPPKPERIDGWFAARFGEQENPLQRRPRGNPAVERSSGGLMLVGRDLGLSKLDV